jgi:hypothetical protein
MIVVSGQHRSRRRHGTVVVWVLLGLSVLIGVLALGLDGGRMMEERRKVQNAADAAALAGARELYLNADTGNAPDKARASAAANGYANDGTASTVVVHQPPETGAFAGQPDCVEVVITSRLQGTFSALFTGGPLQVQARAVARGRPQKIGMILLQSAGPNSLSLGGNGSVTVSGGVMVNSADAQAVGVSGNASLTADYYDLAAASRPSGNITGTVITGVSPAADPFAPLVQPNPSQYPVQTLPSDGNCDGMTLQPGVYPGGISLSGNMSVTLSPGIYIMDGGGFSVTGNASVAGQGVMIFNTGGSAAGALSLHGNGSISLTPPTSGPYKGIGFWQARDVTQALTLGGNGSINITGVVYAPAAQVNLKGNGSADGTIASGFVVAGVSVSGNGSFRVAQGSVAARVPDCRLVE